MGIVKTFILGAILWYLIGISHAISNVVDILNNIDANIAHDNTPLEILKKLENVDSNIEYLRYSKQMLIR
jgi:DNA replication protein DnaC